MFSASESVELDKMAQMASTPIHNAGTLKIMQKQISVLTETVELLSRNKQHYSNHRRHRSYSGGRSYQKRPYNKNLCYCYNTYGDKARKCIQPYADKQSLEN